MTLFFVRHADKANGYYKNANLPHLDQPLSKFEKKQAKKLCKYFLDKEIDEIYVSEYIRTEQTMRPFSRRRNIKPTIDKRLNEIDLGELIGLSDYQFQRQYPDIWKAYNDRNTDFRWPGGETGKEAQNRIIGFLGEKTLHPSNSLVITHDGIIRLLFCYLLIIPVYRRFNFTIGTAGIMEIKWNQDLNSWKIIRVNQEVL